LGSTFALLGLSNMYQDHSQINKITKEVFYNYTIDNQRSTLIFYLTEPIVVTEYTPDNFFTCLAKIGAFLALGRIFMVVALYHEYRFESELEGNQAFLKGRNL
jgi:hypothetical protein